MQPVKHLLILTLFFASCRSVRQQPALPTDVNHLPIAYAVSPAQPVVETVAAQTKTEEATSSTLIQDDTKEQDAPATAMAETKKITTKKVTSFAQMKEMAASGELKMSKKDVKVLNKLDKKYKGNFEQFRADTFEFTDKAKIIAGVGILGLLLAIFTGSWFGAFLFILAALGFILRFLGVIEF